MEKNMNYTTEINMAKSDKNKIVAALLAFFLGGWGIHRFYVGKVGSGVAILLLTIIGVLTSGILIGIPMLIGVSIWVVVDFIVILCGYFKDINNLPLK